MQVCAEEEGGAEEFECAETGVGGTYEIVGLGAGQYSVSFTPGKGQNYVRQFYDGAPTGGYATPVTVASGRTSGIDAVLAKGAKIGGKITAATTGLPVSEALVCAYSAFPSAAAAPNPTPSATT